MVNPSKNNIFHWPTVYSYHCKAQKITSSAAILNGNGTATMRMGHCKCNIFRGDKIFGTALEQAALGVVLF